MERRGRARDTSERMRLAPADALGRHQAMPALEWSISMFAVILFLVVAVALIVGGAVVALRRPSDKGLAALALVACVTALFFIPLLRLSPEQIGLYIFLGGLFPVIALITVAVLTSALRLAQTRRWQALPGLALSVAAAGLMYVNMTTTWIWPYAKS
jgi:hypothetical protein